ncbi:hypothetical protein GPJ56_002373 [Histomonas meleagridis]|nr:hypothetical protein GPJ56_002373 [Histomonas meleagridis]
MIHISKERPFFLNDFRLIDKEILNGYISYSDVSKEISDINSAFKEFVNEKPDVLNYFEMSDMNRFQTKQKIRFVSYSQYEIQSSIIDPNLVIELLTFALKITNLYINKQFSEQIVEKNKQRRDKLIEIAKERQKRYEQLAKAKAEGKRKGMLNQVREMAQAQVEQQQQKKHEKTE